MFPIAVRCRCQLGVCDNSRIHLYLHLALACAQHQRRSDISRVKATEARSLTPFGTKSTCSAGNKQRLQRDHAVHANADCWSWRLSGRFSRGGHQASSGWASGPLLGRPRGRRARVRSAAAAPKGARPVDGSSPPAATPPTQSVFGGDVSAAARPTPIGAEGEGGSIGRHARHNKRGQQFCNHEGPCGRCQGVSKLLGASNALAPACRSPLPVLVDASFFTQALHHRQHSYLPPTVMGCCCCCCCCCCYLRLHWTPSH
jgi:hypothetical protein